MEKEWFQLTSVHEDVIVFLHHTLYVGVISHCDYMSNFLINRTKYILQGKIIHICTKFTVRDSWGADINGKW